MKNKMLDGIQVIEVEVEEDLEYCGYHWLLEYYSMKDLKGLIFDVKWTRVRAVPIRVDKMLFGVVIDNRLYPEPIDVYMAKDGLSFILEEDFDKII